MERHFTVSGFVSDGERTALHWHRIGKWLPAGGHIETNEDPVQAVLREVLEETGIAVEVLPATRAYPHGEPPQLPPPETIGVYDLGRDGHCDGPHQHIDFVYFTRPRRSAAIALPDNDECWRWVEEAALRDDALLPAGPRGRDRRVPEDVRRLAIASIEAARVAPPPQA